MPTAYLSASLLRELTDVSVTPGAGNTGYPLIWNNTSGKFELAVLSVASGGTGTSTGSITGTGALTFTAGGSNQNIMLSPSGTGRLGIRTDSPTTVVDIRGNTRIAGPSGLVSNTNEYALSLQNNASSVWLEMLNQGGVGKGAFFGVVNNDFQLWNFQGGNTVFYNGTTAQSAFPRVTISGSGNLGIGTTSPTSALQVAATTASTSTTTGAARIDGGLGVAGAIHCGSSLTLATDLAVADGGTGTSTGSITGTGALTFTAGGTNQNIALVPSGTGRLGIGTNSPQTVVDIRGNTRIAGVSGVVSSSNQYALSLQNNANQCWLEILNNGGNNRGAFFGMANNDFHLWNFQGGNTIFYTGTAGGSASERVTISGSGNLGIGTTSPTSALQVAATTASTSTTTGAARIDGGLGVAGAIHGGSSLTLASDASAAQPAIVAGTNNGLKIGTATSQKLGFFNATPVVQQAAVADATDAASTQARLNDLLARLRSLGLIAT